jgi:hypothetical protein
VRAIDTLVPKRTTNLEDLVLPAYDQTLEVQLRRDPEPDWHVRQLIRNRLERSRDSASSIDVECRCFDFQKAARYEICAYVIIYERPKPEDIARLIARERVYVGSSGKRLSIVDCFGYVVEGRREYLGHVEGKDGELPGGGLGGVTLDSYYCQRRDMVQLARYLHIQSPILATFLKLL